jgi:hypothetical protein
MRNLVGLLVRQRKLEEAASILAELLDKMKQKIVKECQHTVTSMNNLERLLIEQSKLAETGFRLKDLIEASSDTVVDMFNQVDSFGGPAKSQNARPMNVEARR